VGQQPDRIRVEAAECRLLNPVGNHAGEQVLRERRWRLRGKYCAPAGTQRIKAERPHAVDLGLDGLAVD
jgi:hypothetical protein